MGGKRRFERRKDGDGKEVRGKVLAPSPGGKCAAGGEVKKERSS